MKRHGDLPMLIEHGLDLDTLVFGSQKNETINHDNNTRALRFVHGTIGTTSSSSIEQSDIEVIDYT